MKNIESILFRYVCTGTIALLSLLAVAYASLLIYYIAGGAR